MANIYVDDDIGAGNDGTTWATAWAKVADGTYTAADVTYVAHDHNETTAANVTITVGGSNSDDAAVFMSCTDTSGEPPTTYTRGATINTTGVSDIGFTAGNAFAVFIGFDFKANDDIAFNTNSTLVFIDCVFELTSAGSGEVMRCSADGTFVRFDNCVFKFSHVSQGFGLAGEGARVHFRGCSVDATGSKPTSLIKTCGNGTDLQMDACDWTHTTNVFGDIHNNNAVAGQAQVPGFRNKIGTAVVSTSIVNSTSRVEFTASTTGTEHYGIHFDDGYGVTNSQVTYYNGATYDGTNDYALKTVTKASGKPGRVGHRIHLCDVWAAAAQKFTVQLNGLTASLMDSSQAWIEVIQPDSTGPLGTVLTSLDQTTTNAYGLGTPAAIPTGTAWTSEPASSTAYEPTVTATGSAGVHAVFVVLATGDVQTVYINPNVTIEAP